jgi:ABC-type sugar transport system ATPase subunit
MQASIAIQLQGIEHRYGRRSVLHELDLSVERGEMLALLGASGSGKSTLVRLLAGLEPPDRGSIAIFGRDARKLPPQQRGVALVSQTAGCYDHLTVRENLALARRLLQPPRRDGSDVAMAEQQRFEAISKHCEEWLKALQLQEHAEHRPNELSGGLAQRLAIARAMLSGRPIVLMDEPLAHLHESLRQPIRQLVQEWQRRTGTTCIYITHDSSEAAQIAHRIAVLNAGRIEQIDAPESIYRRPVSRAVAELVGSPPIQWFSVEAMGLSLPFRTIGVRPRDWRCSALEPASDPVLGAVANASRMVVHGTVAEARQIESEWWLTVAFGDSKSLLAVVAELDGDCAASSASQSPAAPRNVGQAVRLECDCWITCDGSQGTDR